VLVLVFFVIGGIMYSSQETTILVQTTTSATSAGQVVINSLEMGVRNSENSLGGSVPLKLTNPTGSDQMLTGLVVGKSAAGTAQCEAWYYSASDGTIRQNVSGTAITAPTSAQLKSWLVLASGVTPITGTTIFAFTTPTLSVDYKVSAGKDPAVPFSSTFASRTGTTGTIACF
jgi:hypothetical protein